MKIRRRDSAPAGGDVLILDDETESAPEAGVRPNVEPGPLDAMPALEASEKGSAAVIASPSRKAIRMVRRSSILFRRKDFAPCRG